MARASLHAVRTGAILAVVAGHSLVSYASLQMPGLLWVIHDRDTSPWFTWSGAWIHDVSRPIFFFLSGFAAARVEAGRGPGGLLRHRARGLLVPFVIGCVVLLPMCYYLWAGGWLVSERCTLKEILAIKFRPEIQLELIGPMHLWFLEDLFLLTTVWCVVRLAERAIYRAASVSERQAHRSLTLAARKNQTSRALLFALPLLLSVPAALISVGNPLASIGHHNSFIPNGWRLLYSGAFFLPGCMLYRSCRDLRALFRDWPAHMALSVPAAAAMFGMIQTYLSSGADLPVRLALAATLALTAWLSVFGVIGFALRYLNGDRPVLRYLADASFWIYLCHLPVVGLVQLDLEGVSIPVWLKFLLVFGLAMFVSLASYQTLVRYTRIGDWLHGPRQRPAQQKAPVEYRRAA